METWLIGKEATKKEPCEPQAIYSLGIALNKSILSRMLPEIETCEMIFINRNIFHLEKLSSEIQQSSKFNSIFIAMINNSCVKFAFLLHHLD